MDTGTSSRNLYIEMAKVIGIVLVVTGHSFGAGLFAAKLYHMPLFFVISGLTLKAVASSDFKDFAIKKLKRLYVPFLVYELVFLALNPLLTGIGVLSEKYESAADFCKALIHILLFDNCNILLSPIWFLTVLFFAICIAFVVLKMVGTNNIAGILGLVHIYAGMILGNNGLLIVSISHSFVQVINVIIMATGYILVGWTVKQAITGDKIRACVESTWVRLLAILLLGVIIVFERITKVKADMRGNTYEMIPLQPILALIGIAGVFAIGAFVVDFVKVRKLEIVEKLICFVARHTIEIMCLHFVSFKLLGLIQVHLLGYSSEGLADWALVDTSAVGLCIATAFGIVIPLCVGYVIDRCKNTKVYR